MSKEIWIILLLVALAAAYYFRNQLKSLLIGAGQTISGSAVAGVGTNYTNVNEPVYVMQDQPQVQFSL